MRIVCISIIALCCGCSTLLAQQSAPESIATAETAATPCEVLSYDSDRKVDELEVRARYLTGHELKSVVSLLGVDDAEIAADKKTAERELFLVLRVKPTEKARGVLTSVKLEIANESPLIRTKQQIALPTLFHGQYFVIKKVCDDTEPRDGSVGLRKSDGKKPIDHVALLHKQKPKFRLRSMVTK